MKRMLNLILSLCMVLGLCACGQKGTAPTWQEQYDLGVRYLSESNYEEAIIAFTAAIEIEPKQEPAYIGLMDTYMAMGDVDQASAVLDQALSLLGETSALALMRERILEELQKVNEPEDDTVGSMVSNVYPVSANQDRVSWFYEVGENEHNPGSVGTFWVEYDFPDYPNNWPVWDVEIEIYPAGEIPYIGGMDTILEEIITEYRTYRDFTTEAYHRASGGLGLGNPIWDKEPVDIVVIEFDKKTENKDAEVVGYMVFEEVMIE